MKESEQKLAKNAKDIDTWLLHCLRDCPDETDRAGIEPPSEADWEELLQQAGRHRIAPLLYHRLRTSRADVAIPPEVAGKLRQAFLGNSVRNMMLYANLGKVLKILRSSNIPVVLLKGLHLAELVYGNRALRYMSDLDLLVKREDLERVDALLLELGCVPNEQNRIVEKDVHEFVYTMPKRDVSLEIHWSILSSEHPFTIDTEGQWERSRPARIDGIDVLVFSPEDLLLHLCLHASFSHGFEPGLKLLCDISVILQHHGKDMDWALVQHRSHEWRVSKCVYLTLKLAVELLGVAVPEGVMDALKPRDFDEHYSVLAKDQIFSRRPRTGPPLSMWPAVARFWGTARLRDKVMLFLRGFFISRSAMARLYPAPADSLRIYLYYVVRLRDVLRTYGRDGWRWLRRDAQMQALAKEGKDITALKDWLMSP